LDPAPYNEPGVPLAEWPWRSRPKFQDRVWRHVILFLFTIGTTTLAGGLHYASFVSDFSAATPTPPFSVPSLFLHGLWYSVTILAILGCHEMGHYLACRYYDVDASLPFFLPAPFLLTGTFGAFIRIREPIPTKRMLFDIGIAGPIAGFVVTLPALLIGVSMSRIVQLPPLDESGGVFSLGEPLLFKLVAWLFWGSQPEGYSLTLHPMAFAAWFGLIATALNLFPIGQLDGGHISYAVLGRRSSNLTLLMVAVALVLAWFSSSWIVWTALVVGMLLMFGRHHPRTADEDLPLDRTRLILAVVALAMLVVCFTPAPIEPMELIKNR
jgi:membrane-associated protease RseP (regulator of RpoE activity)